MSLRVCIVGGGMITGRQILPSIYHLQRVGQVESVTVCARHSARLRELAQSEVIRRAFPGQTFQSYPPLEADPAEAHSDAYRRAVQQLPPRQLVIVATPRGTAHNTLVTEAGRLSLLSGGRNVAIRYEPQPGVVPL